MYQRDVVPLEVVVDVHLPVAFDVPRVAPHELHRAKIDGSDALGDARIDAIEVRHVVSERDEDQTLPLTHLEARQPDVADPEIHCFLHFGRRDQLAFLVVQPAVVLAAQVAEALAAAEHERPRAMATDIRKRTENAVCRAQQHDRSTRDIHQQVIARLGQFGTVGNHLPGGSEDPLTFQLERRFAEVVLRVERVRPLETGRHSCVIHRAHGLSLTPDRGEAVAARRDLASRNFSFQPSRRSAADAAGSSAP